MESRQSRLALKLLERGFNEIKGEYISTDSNAPCSGTYLDAGFAKSSVGWSFNVQEHIEINDPKWLEITFTK